MKFGYFSALLFCTAFLLSGCGARESQEPAESLPPQTAAFTRESKIEDVKNAPVFGSYGRLLFPTDDYYYSGDTLEDLQLTYYSHIDPDETVEIVNTLMERAADGQTIPHALELSKKGYNAFALIYRPGGHGGLRCHLSGLSGLVV